jgi:maspardin
MPTLIEAVDKFRQKTSTEAITLRGRKWKMIDTKSQGPVLIMLPGTLGNADIFFNQINKLGRKIRIIALAYPLITDIDLICGDIVRLMDQLGIEKASILGSSYGGFVAQVFAQNHANRVNTLFIGNSMTDVDLVRPGFPPIKVLQGTPPRDLRAHIAGQMANWAEPEKTFRQIKAFLHRELMQYLPPRGPKMRLSAIFLRKGMPRPGVPDKQIVIIDCEDDPLIPAVVRKDTTKRYPGAELNRFPSGGHFPYLTRTKEYNEIIAKRLL